MLGELAKFVAVSPQRIVFRDSRRLDYAMYADSDGVVADEPLMFDVIGASGENVSLAAVTPQSRVVWVSLTIGSTGVATVHCAVHAPGASCHSI